MAAPLERRFLSNFLSRSPKRLGEGDLTTGHESGIGWCHCVSNNIYIYIFIIYIIFFVTHVMNKQNRVAFDTGTSKLICLRLENEKTICQVDSSTSKFLKHSQKTIQNCQWNQAFQQANYLASSAKYSQASKGCRFCGVQQHDQRLFSPKMKWLENWLLHLFLMEKSCVDWAGIHWKIGAGLE